MPPLKYKKLDELADLGVDRLGRLTEGLLINVLGNLPTRDAVKISLSLKKWENLWKFLPNLEFLEDSSFRKYYSDGRFKSSSFDKFVNKVLRSRDDSVKINKFSYQRVDYSKSVEKVIEFVVSHQIPHFKFCTDTDTSGYISLVNSVGRCDSFKSLELKGVLFDYSLSLKQVVTLHLERTKLTPTESFSGCPNLKDLTLMSCSKDSGNVYESWSIIAPELSRLTMLDCFTPHVTNATVKLSTPRLTFFKAKGCPSLQTTDDLSQLDTVDVAFEGTYYISKKEKSHKMSTYSLEPLISMLNFFHNAKHVTLSHDAVKLLSAVPRRLKTEPSPFPDLKVLKIDGPRRYTTDTFDHSQVFTYLLRESPHATVINKS